jgi:hypothetical protein
MIFFANDNLGNTSKSNASAWYVGVFFVKKIGTNITTKELILNGSAVLSLQIRNED